MEDKQNALALFEQGYNCCQAVITLSCEEYGLDKETALRLASPFGGGMRSGEVCGAVSGALMLIGLKYGFSQKGDEKNKKRVYRKTEQFISFFMEKKQSIICRKLLGFNLARKDDYAAMIEKDIFRKECPKMIETAAALLSEILE